MPTGRPRLSGIVLAGGAGRRMGRPKGVVTLHGVPLAEAAVDILRPHCDEVIVVGRRGIPAPGLDVPLHFDGPGPDAPLTGIATGLGVVAGDDVLVLACDVPFAGPAVAALAAMPSGAAAAAVADGRWQPLCARYPRVAALDASRALLGAGAPAAMGLVRSLGAAPVPVDADALFNVNTADELLAARHRHAVGAAP